MTEFRSKGISLFDGIKEVVDFSGGIRDLPKENVLKYIWNDGSWLADRPSGTEPKIKFYMGVKGSSIEDAAAKEEALKKAVMELVGQ